DYEKARGWRLELEILLAKIQRKVNPQKLEPSDEELRKLLNERVETAKKQYSLMSVREAFTPNKSLLLEELFSCRFNALSYAIEAAANKKERLRAIEEVAKRARDLDSQTRQRVEQRLALPQDQLITHARYLEVEILFVRAKRAAAEPLPLPRDGK